MLPSGFFRAYRSATAAIALLAAGQLLLAGVACAQPAATDTVRLRFYWGGGEQHAWSGRIAAAGGRLTDLQRLNVGPLAAVAVSLADGEIKLRPGHKTTHNAFDATLSRGDGEVLRVELRPDGGSAQAYEIPFQQLLANQFSATLPDGAGRLVVHRLAADQLRLSTGRDRLILTPGEKLPLNVEAVLSDIAPLSPLDLAIEIQRGRAGSLVSSVTHRLEATSTGAATLATELTLPAEEGVYSIRVAAVRPPGLTTRFLPRSTGRMLTERRFQVIVFDSANRPRLGEDRELLAEIDPASPRWWERVPRWVWPRRLPRPELQIGSTPLEIITDNNGNQRVLLPPVDGALGGAWQAYPLPVDGPGLPHVVEVDYPADQPQTLTLSLLDKDATGRQTPLGIGESVFVDDWAAGNSQGETRTARRLFWPRTQQPILMLSNHQAAPARFGKVRVYRLRQQSQPTTPTRIASSSTGPAIEAAAEPANRTPMVALCLTEARIAEALGATLAVAPEGNVAVDDRQTWYETATRLADLVEQQGFNGAVVTVASSQGVAYPSRYYPATPGLDRQPLASSTTDLPRKDLLKLLLLEFDRRGLQLVPAVRFDAALMTQRAVKTGVPNQPVYNLLDSDAAAATRAAVLELVEQGKQHASFSGVAIDLGSGGVADYSILPRDGTPSDGTPSDEQLESFLSAAKLTWPEGVPRNAKAKRIAVNGPWREAWDRWRAAQLAEFYASLRRRVRTAQSNNQLYLLTHGLPRHPELRGLALPTLNSGPTMPDLFGEVGIDNDRLAAFGLAAASTSEILGGRELSSEATSHRVNELTETDRIANPVAHLMISRRPVARRFAPALPNDRITGRLPPINCVNTASNAAALYARLAGAPASSDSSPKPRLPTSTMLEGGSAASLLLDEKASAHRRLLAAASSSGQAAKTTLAASQPVRVRSSFDSGQTRINVVNPLPWPVDVTLTLEATGACNGGWTDRQDQQLGEGQHAISRQLPPHSSTTAEYTGAECVLAGVRSTVDPAARQELAARLQDLKQRDINSPSFYGGAKNLSFEDLNDRQQPTGWQTQTNNAAIRLTDREPKEGRLALEVECAATADARGDAAATLQTVPLPAPRTGQLALTFHLRPEGISEETRVVVRIEEVGGDYVSSTTLDADRLGGTLLKLPETPPASSGWRRPYAFAASDLPIGGGAPIRIVFEFHGPGRIAIDDLQLYDLVFPLNLGAVSTRQKLALVKIIREAESALEANRLAECHRILDGYWPRFLQAYTPLLPETPAPDKLADVDQPDPTATESADADDQHAEGVSTGWRSYLPRFWR